MKAILILLCAGVSGLILLPAQSTNGATPAAQTEKQREDEHPYFRFPELAEAQATARQLHRPLAWICGSLSALSSTNAHAGSEDEITQMSVDYLKSRAVVIFMDGGADYDKSPPAVMEQFNQLDDGQIPGGHHFYVPKIVFTDADVKLQLGRAWYSAMKEGPETVIDTVLQRIAKDPAAQAAINDPAATPAPAP
jgi:hypothetical protein